MVEWLTVSILFFFFSCIQYLLGDKIIWKLQRKVKSLISCSLKAKHRDVYGIHLCTCIFQMSFESFRLFTLTDYYCGILLFYWLMSESYVIVFKSSHANPKTSLRIINPTFQFLYFTLQFGNHTKKTTQSLHKQQLDLNWES